MNYHDRSDVFRSKAELKQTGIAIYENMTSRRLALLNAAKGIVGIKKCFVTGWKSFCNERWQKSQVN